MKRLKFWLANNIIVFFYKVLYWAWAERLKGEATDVQLVFWDESNVKPGDRARMN